MEVTILVSSCFFAFVGWDLLQRGLKSIHLHKQLRERGLTTTGKLIYIRDEEADRTKWSYPLFSYNANGKIYESEAELDSEGWLSRGKTYPVHYLPEKPEQCYWRKTPFWGYFHCLLGILLVLFCIGGFLKILFI